MSRIVLAIFCLAVGATAANAREDGLFPDPFPDTVVAKADQQRPPVLRFRLGPIQGLLEKTTLGQLQRRLGGRIVRNNGDAAEGEYHLCYFLAAGGGPQVHSSSCQRPGLCALPPVRVAGRLAFHGP